MSVKQLLFGNILYLFSVVTFARAGGPDYYKVKGVAANDSLNIRADHSVRAIIVDTIPPNGVQIHNLKMFWPIEEQEPSSRAESPSLTSVSPEGERSAIAQEHRWCLVEYEKVKGWVYCKFLVADEKRDYLRYECAGTEPFWALQVREDGITFTRPGVKIPRIQFKKASVVGDRIQVDALTANRAPVSVHLFVDSECNREMVEGVYTHRVSFSIDKQQYFGCCTRLKD